MGSNALLAVGKIASGAMFRSQAILADGLHSLSDLVTDLAVLAGIGVASKPADPCHPYGHQRFSTVVALFVGVMLLAAAGWIGYDAVVSLPQPHSNILGIWPLVMAVATIPVKEALFRLTRLVGLRSKDSSIVANAWHHRSDAFTSVAAAGGIAGVMIGGEDWAFLDHATALVLVAFLAVAAVRIVGSSLRELVDEAPSTDVVAPLRQAVLDTPGVRSFHEMRARKTGGRILADVHVQVDPELSVREGHDIASAVRRSVIAANEDVAEVVVHVEPDESENPPPSGLADTEG
jgi:cation diffusion facilitator family transporter